MKNKFPIYLAEIKTSSDGYRKFVKSEHPYKEIIWGTPYNKYLFDSRREYLDKPNCNFNCPSGREFFCCREFDCRKHYGFFEWEEISFFSDSEKDKILSLWNKGTGFQRKDGCILSRELRSYVCLTYACRNSKEG